MKVEAYDAAMRRMKSRDIDDLVELPFDVPLSVDGTVLDPPSEGTVVGDSGIAAGESAGEAALQRLRGGV